ncbi:hypothetical protein VTL71DRAFT_8842 [Oculimacula yallundae]|uniref:Cytochrome P450 n=1 Tax=Oculimacula yallundae TaxID=86028 RepID=A0ABR4BT24_9HELO
MISIQHVSVAQLALLSLILIPGYYVATVIYNVYFHPLRNFPGPFWWRATHIPWAWHGFRGTLTRRICELQREYRGTVLRVAPNELHFFRSQAWNDIYGHKSPSGNTGNLPKTLQRTRETVNGATNVFITGDRETHRRMRRLLAHAFSDKALTEQLPLINTYIDLLITNLRQKASQGSGSAIVDVVQWYNFTTFDIIGDLTFGEAFGCLRDGVMHSWISNVFFSVKDSSLDRAARVFPRPIYDYIMSLRPQSGVNAQKEEFLFASEKAKTRIESGNIDRVDFMSYILKHNDERGMTMPEIESNSTAIILAGSETIAAAATFLSGITFLLLKNPTVYAKLRDIIRSTFEDEAAMTPTALTNIEYFTACIEESLRFYPSVPLTGVDRITEPEGSHIDGMFIPGNTYVVTPQMAMNMSEDNFADPEKFVPERWLKDDACPERYRGDDRKAMQPFSFGPRNCLGKNLAYVEMRVIFARMLWNFDMQLMDNEQDWRDQPIFILWEKKPLNVKLTIRQS